MSLTDKGSVASTNRIFNSYSSEAVELSWHFIIFRCLKLAKGLTYADKILTDRTPFPFYVG